MLKTKKGRNVTRRYIPIVINGYRFEGKIDTKMPKLVFNMFDDMQQVTCLDKTRIEILRKEDQLKRRAEIKNRL